jgi:hypothetical protein
MNSHATARFWRCYGDLPAAIQGIAVKQYRLWRQDPHHPSLQFKKVAGAYWSARVTDDYRAVGIMEGDTVIWFWVGTHAAYDRLLGSK